MNLLLNKMIRIYHIADIHICKEKHEKIKFAKQQLLEKIKSDDLIKTPENIYVVIAGDIFEHKNNYWGSDLELWHEMLQEFEDLKINTRIIPGNHDIYYKNKKPRDLVSSSLLNTRYSQVRVFPTSKIYKENSAVGFLEFHVYSPLDEECPEGENTNAIKLALVHEPIRGARLSSGIVDFKTRFCAQDLQHYDITMMGDIHRRQFLLPNVAYSGSFIQKTRGENLFHGGISWTIKKSNSLQKLQISSEIMNFKLLNAYVITRINKKKVEHIHWENVESASEIQIRYKNADPEILKKTQKDLKKKGRVILLDYSPVNTKTQENFRLEADNHKLQLAAIRNRVPGREDIVKLHVEKIRNMQVNKLQQWRPLIMRWSNMYKYGENNEFNFTNLRMLNSIVGDNMTGKSSILDIMVLILFNETLRGIIPSAIRAGTSGFSGEIEFQVLSSDKTQHYKIIRKYDINKQTRAELYINGEKQQFTSIKNLYDFVKLQIGSVNNFKNICLRAQNANSWADLSGAVLDKNLTACFDFSWLENLQKSCKKELKEMEIELRSLTKNLEDLENILEISEIKSALKKIIIEKPENITLLEVDNDLNLSSARSELKSLEIYKHDLRKITQEFMKLQPEKIENIENLNIENIEASIKNTEQEIEKLNKQKTKFVSRAEDVVKLQNVIQNLPNHNPHCKKISATLKQLKNNDFPWSFPKPPVNSRLQELRDKFRNSENQIDVKTYEKLQFSNTCESCKSNKNKLCAGSENEISELMEMKTLEDEFKINYDKYLQKYQEREIEKEKAQEETILFLETQEKYEKFQKLNSRMIEYQNYEVRRSKKLQEIQEKLQEKNAELEKLQEKKEKYYRNEKNIKIQNKIQQIKILLPKLRRRDHLRKQIPRIEKNINSQKIFEQENKKYWNSLQKKEKLEQDLIKAEKKKEIMKKVNELQSEVSLLKDYIKVIDNKGIVRTMIHLHLKQLLPHMNNMLSKLTDFNIKFDVDNTPILISDELMIPGNLSSGYQKFIIDFIIRIVLLKSNLTLPKILFIDEGFGCMDSKHLSLIKDFIEEFQEDSENPQFVFISHLAEMKHMGKNIIVKNKNNVSSCCF